MREVKRLQGCINDLIGVVALSAVWASRDPEHIVDTLLRVLMQRLTLEFAAARVSGNSPSSSTEMLRAASSATPGRSTVAIPTSIMTWLDAASALTAFKAWNPFGIGEISVVPFRFGPHSHIGTLVVGSARPDFPTEIEMLVLRIAVNQAGMALHEAQRTVEQKSLGLELEERITSRTAELTNANRQLTSLKDELGTELRAMNRLHE
ncbi:MAG: sensor signal transduction histidine kinase, partial [Gammaproteobacteria bacterium]|nr:sensor signal transduction histidine kinase [Gammaproteobacteria bacterium]